MHDTPVLNYTLCINHLIKSDSNLRIIKTRCNMPYNIKTPNPKKRGKHYEKLKLRKLLKLNK
jgi:hypothetical protein